MRRSTGAILRETRPETIITSAWRGLARKTSEPKRARSWRASVVAIISMAQQARPKVAGHKLVLRAQLPSESSRVVITSGSASAMTLSKPIKPPCSQPRPKASLPTLARRRLSPPSRGARRLQLFGRAPPRLGLGECARLGLGLHARAVAPLEQPLLDDVDVADQKQHVEEHHLDVDERAETSARRGEGAEDHGPGDEEDQLDVEEDEDHRDQVELYGEALARRPHGVFAALVGHRLRPRRLVLDDELRQKDVSGGEAHGDDEHQHNGQVVGEIEDEIGHTSPPVSSR